MPTARYGAHAAVVGGRIYVVGGSPSFTAPGPLTSVEVYDPASDAWSSAAPMPVALNGFGMGVGDGNVHVFGGGVGYALPIVDQHYAYDPATNKWRSARVLSSPRASAMGVTLQGHLHVIGGYTNFLDESSVVAIHEEYDGVMDTWMPRTPIPTARAGAAAAVLQGEIHVLGGFGASPIYAKHEVYAAERRYNVFEKE